VGSLISAFVLGKMSQYAFVTIMTVIAMISCVLFYNLRAPTLLEGKETFVPVNQRNRVAIADSMDTLPVVSEVTSEQRTTAIEPPQPTVGEVLKSAIKLTFDRRMLILQP
jgi:hypothetical protein